MITCTLAMLGLGGVCLNSLPLLTASISLILLLVTVEVVAGLSSYYYLDTLAVFLHHQLLEGLKVFNHQEFRGVTETWNVAQHEVSGHRDNSSFGKKT